MNRSRGAVQAVVLLYVVGAAALTQLVPNWRVTHLFQKGPQTKELAAAQAELAKVKQQAEEAQKKYDAALQAQKDATTEQVRYAQQFAAGIPPLLDNAPQTPEVKLANVFALRVNKGLAAAIGELPVAKQQEILSIIEDALSTKQEEVEKANRRIAELDAELAVTNRQKAVVEAQLPLLQKAKEAAEAKAEAKEALVVQKTAEVVQYANEAALEKKQNGSLGAAVERFVWGAGVLAALYALFHFILPSLAQEYPGISWLQHVNKTLKSLSSAHV